MSHLRDIVKPHQYDTMGLLVAERDPCLAIADEDRLAQSGRLLRLVTPAEIHQFQLPASWAMAVVLCPGDDTEDLARWATRRKVHLGRIHFYYHPTADPRKVLKAWADAGLAILSTAPAKAWSDLSSHFGKRLNSACHDDFCPDAGCTLRDRG